MKKSNYDLLQEKLEDKGYPAFDIYSILLRNGYYLWVNSYNSALNDYYAAKNAKAIEDALIEVDFMLPYSPTIYKPKPLQKL